MSGPSAPSSASFASWRQASFRLAGELQQLSELAARLDAPELAAEAEALHQRVVERRFSLAVLGEFKRGKSTFLNALMGQEILPADVLPATATVNRVTWGYQPGVELRFRDGRPAEHISTAALVDRVTKLSAEAGRSAAELSEAVVTYPVPLCRNDVDLLDTPGLSDEAAMTALTEALLPTVDAAIFVLMATAPFSESEAAFVDRLFEIGVSQIFFVVTGIDRVRRPADRARLLEAIEGRVRARLLAHAERLGPPESDAHQAFLADHTPLQLHAISAVEGLEGKREGDPELLARSGLPALEAALEAGLTAADGIGLRRRLGQTRALIEALDGQLSRAAAQPGPASPSAERAQLLVLMDALEPHLDAARLQASGWIPAALTSAAPMLAAAAGPQGLRLEAFARVDQRKAALGAGWPAQFDALSAAMAQDAREALAEGLVHVGDALLDTVRAAASPQLAAVDQVLSATFALLDLAARRSAGQPEAPPIDPPNLCLREGLPILLQPRALAAAAPSAARLLAALVAPSVPQEVLRAASKSDLNRLFSFDFGGTGAAWHRAAREAIGRLCEAELSADQLRDHARAWLEAEVRAAMSPLDEAARALRQARAALMAAEARAAAASVHGERALAHERVALDRLRASTEAHQRALALALRPR